VTTVEERDEAPTPAPSATTAIELRNVTASYGRTRVLTDVSIAVRAGGVTALIGPNGAGKTTSLKVASGLLKPNQGSVFLHGKDVTKVSSHRRAARGLCHVPEGRGIYRNLTVRENLVMQITDGSVSAGIERATTTFPILGKRLKQQAGTLSGGEQQMLSLSSAYLRNPSAVLVDEPSLGLAPIIVDVVFEFLETLRRQNSALLLVDQYATRALSIADDVYVLRRGTIVFQGAAAELLSGNMFESYIGEGLS
jgi:branched-chain amino acid transport system ATP-binding protein